MKSSKCDENFVFLFKNIHNKVKDPVLYENRSFYMFYACPYFLSEILDKV